ncbi:hypothetical protein ACQ86K_22175 [Mucilaginibacter sp. P19]|uniref:hypothetical protein n=1 Tax=Mucilaginibacter sp. P19 TaxID=3423947 RepID=UPI003D6646C1
MGKRANHRLNQALIGSVITLVTSTPMIMITTTTFRIPKPGIYMCFPVLSTQRSLRLSALSMLATAQYIRKIAAPTGTTTNIPFTKYLNNARANLFILSP